MRIAAYAEAIRSHIHRTPYVISHSLAYDDRPPVAGIIKGSVTFADGSRLYFKEFIRFTEPVVRLKYAYHYVSIAVHLIFRFDNALDPAARHLTSYPHHQHLPGGIHPSGQPLLEEVLREALRYVKRS